ncbi:MAG: SUF system NifU family Fe-S cluster assembly protein [Gammaproteobacteria bacterium]|nr:SUF system NifU family Fe-S cluster assembly protein [Gammaproteobacteria bacterium]
MNIEIPELYQEVILGHGKNPRNQRRLNPCTHTYEGFNPLCGDRVTVYLVVEQDIIQDISFEGAGCVISMASASLMTELLKGKKLAWAKEVLKSFYHSVTQDFESLSKEEKEALGEKLLMLGNVQKYPMRVKCATLVWHAVEEALGFKQNEENPYATF